MSTKQPCVNTFLDQLLTQLNLKNDAALSKRLDVAPPVISKIRHGKLPVGASMILRLHEVSNLSIKSITEAVGYYSKPRR